LLLSESAGDVQSDIFDAMPSTPPKRTDLNTMIPSSCPPKIGSSTFAVWEDPSLPQTDAPLSPVPTRVESIDPDMNKENEPSISRSISNTPSSHQKPLQEIPTSSLKEYNNLNGHSFKVLYSPLNSYKAHVSPLKYNKDLPPPSQQTRTVGAKQYRSTTKNIFNTIPDLRPVLNELSPSTPMRVPDYQHSSRVMGKTALGRKLNLAPVEAISEIPSGGFRVPAKRPSVLHTAPENDTVPKSPETLKEPKEQPNLRSRPNTQLQPSPLISYVLRPRPTPKPDYKVGSVLMKKKKTTP
jgi:hypothetical protein